MVDELVRHYSSDTASDGILDPLPDWWGTRVNQRVIDEVRRQNGRARMLRPLDAIDRHGLSHLGHERSAIARADLRQAVREAGLRPLEREALLAIEEGTSAREFASRKGMRRSTAQDLFKRAGRKVAAKMPGYL